MSFLRIILAFLWFILRDLLFGWMVGLWRAVRVLLERCLRAHSKECLPGRQGKASPNQCVPISNPAMNRPDPLIYDQYYLMALGFAVTWDNPDIWLELGGVIVPADQLLPNTTYDLMARIWNSSTEGVCAGLPVSFSYLSFGSGVHSNPVLPGPDTVAVNLGGKGGPSCPALATTKWTTPPVAGHYCLQVSFSWIDDSNPYNNLGQKNTQVGISHSPVTFQFQLRNQKRVARTFRFEADSYVIPPVPDCGEKRNRIRTGRAAVTQRPFDPVVVPQQHRRANYPLAPGWAISFSPANPQLAPEQELTITATVNPPTGFSGKQPINVHVFSDSGLAGGMTFYVRGT